MQSAFKSQCQNGQIYRPRKDLLTNTLFFGLLVSLTSAIESSHLSPRVVRTKYGALRGVIITLSGARKLRDVEAFYGIPYAAPPTGNLRFMPPGSPSPWRGIRKANTMSPVCPQKLPDITNQTEALKKMNKIRYDQLKRLFPYLRNQSEDCLHLNIYTPSGASTRNFGYPVMIYIHGESYEWNSGNPYDGSVLASYGQVIVVTVNFRLGILGFLNTNDHPHERSIANYGLMDQIAALHWLRENVAEFGGDPDNLTIVGHGTGAACVNFLMTSRAVPPNLFKRAILMSGSSLSPWAEVRNPKKYTKQIAKALNCTEDHLGEELKNCLKLKPLEDIMSVEIKQVPIYYYSFGPTVDGVVIDTELDTNTPSYVSRLSSFDLMFGLTSAEAFSLLSDRDVRFGLEKPKRDQIVRSFVRNTYNYHLSEIFATVINEYTDWSRIGKHPITTRDETLNLLSDGMYGAPMVHTASLYANPNKKSFFYLFNHHSRNNDKTVEGMRMERIGSIQGDDLAYMWGAPLVENFSLFSGNFSQAETQLSEVVLTFWSNFARIGNPNGAMNSDEKDRRLRWSPYEVKHERYIELGIKPRVKDHYKSHELSFWLQLVPQLHRAGEDAPVQHNYLDNHNDWSSYRGYVRSRPMTRIVYPLTTIATTTRQYNVSAVLQSTPSSGMGSKSVSVRDGLSSYSTALSVTIAIGCSLLILNLVIFAGIYYQRDKCRINLKKSSENGGILGPAHSISGDIHTPSTTSSKGSRIEILNNGSKKAKIVRACGGDNSSGSSQAMSLSPVAQTHLPPPEFADYPPSSHAYGTMVQISSAASCGRSASNGASLTLSVPRVPVPPQAPVNQKPEIQSLIQQGSYSVSTINSPSKDQNVGELRV